MRHLVVCALLTLTSLAAHAANPVTVLLDFRNPTSSQAVDALKAELTRLMKPAGMEFGYHLGSELGPSESPTDIIVIRFKGACRRDELPPLLDERGPYAYTHVTNGQILPFAEVACDRVHSSVRSVTGKLIATVSDEVLGRALARVVAHELYHIIAKTQHHSDEGVAREGLTSRDLVAQQIDFSEYDIRKLTKR